MSHLRAANLYDALGNPIGSRGGSLDVNIENEYFDLVNRSLHFHTGLVTTLAVATDGDGTEYQITVADPTGFNVGDFIHIENGEQEPTHSQIVNIAGSIFDLDRRIDLAHPIGAEVEQSILDLKATAGTLAAPIIYWTGPDPGEEWQLTRMIFAMAHSTAGDLGKFGNLPSLTNGVVVRVRNNSSYRTLTNWKNSGDMKGGDMYDVEFDSRSGGGGDFGTSGRWTFQKGGVVVKLNGDTNDRIEVLIQDDLTTLGFFKMKVQGRIK